MRMFFRLFVVAILLSYTASVGYSQLVVHAGVNASSWRLSSGNASFDFGSKSGYHVGFQYRNNLSDNFKISPGLQYSQKGSDIFGILTSNLNYLELPLMFVFQTGPDKGFFLEGGAYAAYLLSASEIGVDVKDEFKSIDYGVNLGLGYDFKRVLVGLRVGVGLANIDNDEFESTLTNTNVQLYIGIKL
ncbi:MAG TPA: porin family protein [Saprospiraceae bacterium]|nr:porin family protein [Saprospiraceae bacterium]